ncbi:MAG: hypothetical protein UU77_C0033G0004 [candidate division WWE3 bacterium GW2011_GWC1_41_7]|uniref:PT repeat-containing protein n=3 Tax=Katanobacteria TaxID=422282 RepID=A0A0G0XA26_UNCKA|nr:MAG: hypothetical protein UU72_C0035G0009 [candidate division WWE3 bacterium GW2011_GWB1_41_6]KKS20048.1 MAG: hypothetical protein UU77_C0033G0004 [candidate division WWE3 bacterium GW2011_GWC1_41_7]KKS21790.1 MAG: hypothetical protein UU80_C0020G0004 [candidate division WWE3 bacterium GW2011_GWA1_41_8]
MEPNNINNTNTNDTSSINFSRIPPTPPVPPARTKPIKPQNNMKLKKMILALLAVAVVITGGLYLYMQKVSSSPAASPQSEKPGEQVETIENPITGELTPITNKEASADLRPMAVMVNNHTDARPQSGLIYADLTYEVVAEGGITRFLPFYLSKSPEKIGPVRSTREYYLVLVKELGDAMLMHIGWSPQALYAIENWPVRSLGRGGGTFWRDTSLNVATEHTAYTNGVELREIAAGLGWDGEREFDRWKFKDDKTGYDTAPAATNISIDFWTKGDYSAVFKYDPASNSYLRFMGYDLENNLIAHIDRETSDQIKPKTVIVQFATESGVIGDDKSRLEYQLIGSGEGLVFMDGKVIKTTWTKPDREARTKFYDLNGQEVEFNRGKFWISIVPDRNVDQVVYSSEAQ